MRPSASAERPSVRKWDYRRDWKHPPDRRDWTWFHDHLLLEGCSSRNSVWLISSKLHWGGEEKLEGLRHCCRNPLFLLVGEAGLLRDARHRLLSARALCAVCCNNPDLQQTTRRCGCLLVRTHAPLLLDGCAVVESADPMVYKGRRGHGIAVVTP